MRRAVALFAGAVLGIGAGALGAHAYDEGDKKHDPNHECITYWGEARYSAYGYNHIVHVESECAELAHCEVWTNVNPERQDVGVEPREHEEVVTFIGSPAREFTPSIECTLED